MEFIYFIRKFFFLLFFSFFIIMMRIIITWCWISIFSSFTVAISVTSLIIFFVLVHHPNYNLMASLLSDISHSILLILSSFAILIGFFKMRNLKFLPGKYILVSIFFSHCCCSVEIWCNIRCRMLIMTEWIKKMMNGMLSTLLFIIMLIFFSFLTF